VTLQKKTLQRYRQFYPQQTLREVSAVTGIQITRVFRLFNGKTMKVGELEAFERAITNKIAESPNFSRLSRTFEDASTLLTNEELGKIADYIERKVTSKRYCRTYISLNLPTANIA
jgi:hypothetical protein